MALGLAFLINWQMQSTQHGTLGHRLDIYSYIAGWIAASPLYGHGTGITPHIFAQRAYAMGGDEVYEAHNLWLQVGVETGILGLLVFLTAVGFIVRAYISAWRNGRDDPVKRASLAAYTGIGVAVILQSLLDNMFWKSVYQVGLITILALLFSLAAKSEFFEIRKKIALPILSLIFILCVVGTIGYFQGLSNYSKGKAAAGNGDWQTARTELCIAAETNTGNSYYATQCSLANAHIAAVEGDQRYLAAARSYQLRALAINPNWYLDWANLASYEWQLGEHESAIEHMRKATEMAPRRTFLWLNLALVAEAAGYQSEAKEAYQVVYCQIPQYSESTHFEDSTIFKQAVEAGCPSRDTPPRSDNTFNPVWRDLSEISSSDLEKEEASAQRSVQNYPHAGVTHANLARIHYQQGKYEQAHEEIETALFMENQSVPAQLAAAQIAFAEGDDEIGYEHLATAFRSLEMSNISGRYYLLAYHDWGMSTDSSPYLRTVLLSEETVSAFSRLADYLEQNGDKDLSIRVNQWLNRNT
jgi:tetratricopeptide (TPR) repeat protein